MKWHTLISVLTLLLGASYGIATDRNYVVKHFTTENGLPQNSIKDLVFDKYGYCWIGTENGLVKFDGISFSVFTAYDVAPQSPRVRFLKKTDDGEILAVFEMGEHYFLREKGHFGMQPVYSHSDMLPSSGNRLFELKSEVEDSLFEFIKSRSKYLATETFVLGREKAFIISADTVWIASQGEHYHFIKTGRPELTRFTLIEDQLLIFSGASRASTVDITGKVTAVELKGPFFDQVKKVTENFSFMSFAGKSYAFFNGALYGFSRSGDTIFSEIILTGLDTNSIYDLYHDPVKDHYYLQSQLDGLYIATPRRFQNVTIPELGNWLFNSFYGQNKYSENSLLANGHLFTFDAGKEPPKVDLLIPLSGSLFSSYLEGDSCYYQENFNLYSFNIKTKKSRTIANLNDLSHCIGKSEFDSKIYLSTTDKLLVMDNDTVREVLRLPANPQMHVYSFKQISPDEVLFATSKGLWKGNLKNKKTEVLIPEINVRNIFTGAEGYIWLGSYNEGAWIMKDGKYRKLPIDKTRRMSVVNSIFEDRKGRIWFSTNNGLLYASRKEAIKLLHNQESGYIRYTVFDKSDGLITNEFNGGATPDKVYLDDGRISIPSLKSLVLFDPESFPLDTTTKKVFIDRLNIDGRAVQNLSTISLEPDYKSMTLSISSPWDSKGETLNFEWMIEGKESEWVSTLYGEVISLRGYRYGNYTLIARIKGIPESAIHVPFYVKPFFYEMAWFRGLFVLSLAFLGLVYFRYSVRKYRKENSILENKIQERTSELNTSLKNLSETVEQLQDTESRLHTSISQKDRIINMLLHDMKSPLFALKNGIEELDDKLNTSDKIHEEVLYKSALLRDGIGDVYSFSVNFFDWVKYQKEGIVANYQPTNLKRLLSTIDELYGAIAAKKGISLSYSTDDFVFYTDENILVTILRNLVDNAIKNTSSGSIHLSAQLRKEEYLTITVRDSGPGMPPEILESIENAFNESAEIKGPVGYGYKLILHLVELIHADLELENKNGLNVSLTLNYITVLSTR